jgi:hypothetical protein
MLPCHHGNLLVQVASWYCLGARPAFCSARNASKLVSTLKLHVAGWLLKSLSLLSSTFTELQYSVPCSEEHTIGLYRHQSKSNLPSHNVLLIIILYYIVPPLLSRSQSSWLQIQRSGFDSRHCQSFWEVVGLEQGSTQPREYNWGATWEKK